MVPLPVLQAALGMIPFGSVGGLAGGVCGLYLR